MRFAWLGLKPDSHKGEERVLPRQGTHCVRLTPQRSMEMTVERYAAFPKILDFSQNRESMHDTLACLHKSGSISFRFSVNSITDFLTQNDTPDSHQKNDRDRFKVFSEN